MRYARPAGLASPRATASWSRGRHSSCRSGGVLDQQPGPQRHPGRLIPAGAVQELGAQFLIHRHYPPGSAHDQRQTWSPPRVYARESGHRAARVHTARSTLSERAGRPEPRPPRNAISGGTVRIAPGRFRSRAVVRTPIEYYLVDELPDAGPVDMCRALTPLPGRECHGAVADDRGSATDGNLGDLAVLLVSGALQRAWAPHGHSLGDLEMVGAVLFR